MLFENIHFNKQNVIKISKFSINFLSVQINQKIIHTLS